MDDPNPMYLNGDRDERSGRLYETKLTEQPRYEATIWAVLER